MTRSISDYLEDMPAAVQRARRHVGGMDLEVGVRELPPEAAHFAKLLRERLPYLQERYGVGTLALFGSYVRGEHHLGSDLDVLVEFDRTPSLFDHIDLKDELTDLLGIRVDLVQRKTLRPHIGRVILREAVLL